MWQVGVQSKKSRCAVPKKGVAVKKKGLQSNESISRSPKGWPDLETLVRQHSLRRTCLSGSNDAGHVRCASAKRRPAHAMSKIPPMKSTSCSGADPLQIQRSHCTSAAKSTGNASRLGHVRQRRPGRGETRIPGLIPPHGVYLQRPRQRSGGFGSSGVGHPLPVVLRLAATVLLARWRIFLLFWLRASCRPSSERTCREQRRLLHRTQTFHLQSHWLSGLCSESLWPAREAARRRASWSQSWRWQGLARNGPLEGARGVWACCFRRIHLQKVPPFSHDGGRNFTM